MKIACRGLVSKLENRKGLVRKILYVDERSVLEPRYCLGTARQSFYVIPKVSKGAIFYHGGAKTTTDAYRNKAQDCKLGQHDEALWENSSHSTKRLGNGL
ncbi:hypothetical protein C4T61_19990, partial [Clostridioides difficile]